ncbi:histone-lysine N-methyltransferase PRDM9-like isoform X2 [Artemia franciscana]|uniref:histone-lysine N-methyltransferase PRDM9-like isoform X2 n=1 Tax=Artemia franciscana TaxID=6661 RepID=UPI0032DADA3B
MTYEKVKDVKYFFTEEQWTRMGEYERNMCRNQLEFYKFKKLKLGIEPEKTGYMKHYEKRLAEEEKARQKEARNKAKSKDMGQVNFEAGPSTSNGSSKSKGKSAAFQPPARVRRVKQVYYHMFYDDPDYDLLISCDICEKEYRDGKCPEHGGMTWIPNAKVQRGIEDRARETLPGFLRIGNSLIPKAGLGVFANEMVPNRVVLGPYEGEEKRTENGDYSWRLKVIGAPPFYIDGENTREANWMRYVNCARFKEEQNLAPFQYKGNLFYRTIKPIVASEELLVWYGDEYAEALGIPLEARKPSDFAPSRNQEQLEQKKSVTLSPRMDKSLEGPIQGHEKVHSGEKAFKCAACEKRFTSFSYLKGHERSHSGKTPFKCLACEKCFIQSSDLKRHERIHSGEKLFKCPTCEKRFSDIRNLNAHILTHTGEKPYKCEICQKGFTRRYILRKHESTKHCNYKQK